MFYSPAPQNTVLATYADLQAVGVCYNTARSWVVRGKCKTIRIGGRTCLQLSGGAEVADAVENARRTRFNSLLKGIETAIKESPMYLEKYLKGGYDLAKANYLSELEAAYTYLIINRFSDWENYQAFNSFFPNKISFNTFKKYCYRIKTKGFEEVLRDKRGKRDRSYPKSFDNLIFNLLKDPKRYNYTFIYNRLREYCEKEGVKTPSLRWVQLKCNELSNYAIESRQGKSKSMDILPYARLEQAQNPNTQWQIDGFTLPYYCEGFKRLTLIAVLDSYSRAYVGYSIAESENTESILEALADALDNTGYIPAEIVFDNHSFHKTQEAGKIVEDLAKLGCHVTVSENPRQKSLIERSFNTLNEQYLKQFAGYIGQGIKSRLEYGRPAPEYTDQFQRAGKWLTKDQIRLNAAQAIFEYNNTPKLSGEKRDLPRMEAYKSGQNRYGIKCDTVTRSTLFVRKVAYKVRNGQIAIVRGGKRHEYMFNSEEFLKYNGKTVFVCYSDFSEIYVFDQDMNFVCTLKEKASAFAALADRKGTEPDGMHVVTGIKKGIRNRVKAKEMELEAATDPEAFERMNPLTRSKEAIEEIRRRGWTEKESKLVDNKEYLRPVEEKRKFSYGVVKTV